MVAFVVAFSDAGVPFSVWLYLEAAFVILAVTWIARIVVAILKRTPEGRLVQSQLRYFVSIPAILILATALGGSPALLLARVYLSEDSLVHTQTSNGPDDRWIGLFHVRETWRYDNEVRFLTNECGLLDNCGIILSPDAPPKHRGEDSFTHLYGPWWHWYQSW
jgi:hypothetical protein